MLLDKQFHGQFDNRTISTLWTEICHQPAEEQEGRSFFAGVHPPRGDGSMYGVEERRMLYYGQAEKSTGYKQELPVRSSGILRRTAGLNSAVSEVTVPPKGQQGRQVTNAKNKTITINH